MLLDKPAGGSGLRPGVQDRILQANSRASLTPRLRVSEVSSQTPEGWPVYSPGVLRMFLSFCFSAAPYRPLLVHQRG